MKISGRRPRLSDFLPKFARPKTDPAKEEAILQAQIRALAEASKNHP